MRYLLLLLLLCGFPTLQAQSAEPYFADKFFKPETENDIRDGYRPTSIWWKNWKVSSSEELWAGRTLTGFPLTHLFDGNPRTTWAHSSNSKKSQWEHGGWRSRFALHIWNEIPVIADELRIMNGDNRRRDLFLRNDRVMEMEIWVSGKRLKTTRLSDNMGWRRISLPSRKVQGLGLVLTRLRKGNGPANDVCLSELALYNRGHKINIRMPQAVLFEDGNYSGDAPLDCALIAPNGKVVTQGTCYANDWQPEEGWSPNERYFCGLWMQWPRGTTYTSKPLLWVADTRSQKVIKRLYLPQPRRVDSDMKDLKWIGNKTVEVRWMDYEEQDNEMIKYRKRYSIN